MAVIHVLDKHTAELIAAGEVVRDLIEGTRESVQRAGNAEMDGKKMQENKNEK